MIHLICVSNAVINVEVAVVGFIPTVALPSLSYMRPVYEIAAEEMNRLYNGTLKFHVHFLTDQRLMGCLDVAEFAEQIVAEWYYKLEHKANGGSVIVLSPPGNDSNATT